MNRVRLGVLVSVLGIALAACSGTTTGGGQQAAAGTVAPSSAAVPYPNVVMPEALRGTWIANVQRPGPSSGNWRLRIGDHLMELKNPESADDSGYFWVWTDRIDGTSFHIAADGGCPDLSFSYTLTGGQLVMTTNRPQPTTTDDTCGDPVVILTTPWTRLS
jgi:hypothetical protein